MSIRWHDEEFGDGVCRDMLDMLLGERIGEGAARTVYELATDPKNYVVKIENAARSFQNVKEWEMWNEAKWHEPTKRWLAPCWGISASGAALIQRRTQPIPQNKLPRLLPAFLTDVKEDNLGLLNGRVVCHDYGLTIVHPSLRMVRSGFK